MDFFYSREKNVQILISLLKANNIKKLVLSPGTTNVAFVASIQQDPFFEAYSSADERSAAYIACGLAAESGEPVVLSCTGATASRNYIPALTEAYYRKLPVLAVTSTPPTGRVGQNFPQILDRSTVAADIAKISLQVPIVHSDEEEWEVNTKINRALLELKRRGGGPVHINLETQCDISFDVKELPKTRVIKRITAADVFPKISAVKAAILVGSHAKWSDALTNAVNEFCEKYNGVVLCDQTSNYKGKYKVMYNIIGWQERYYSPCKDMELLIDIGNISGAYMPVNPKNVWRVNPDGEIRDTHKKLTCVFEMEEIEFFNKYNSMTSELRQTQYYNDCKSEFDELTEKIPELPFSNIWIAKEISENIPSGSILHLGILNSLRAWNFFETPDDVLCYSNTGGFGIDGCVSSLIGASLFNPEKLCFGVVGDLAFFYDMNSLGNRHIKNNLRLMVINNGKGTEFRNYSHNAARFGEAADEFIAAAGHYGNKSENLIKDYVRNLGYEYICASDKEEFLKNIGRFLNPDCTDRSIVFEVFTGNEDESRALFEMNNLKVSPEANSPKKVIKELIGEKGVSVIKKIISK